MEESELKENSELNELIQELRNCLMPTHPIEELFNLTFDVERPKYTTNEGGNWKITDWDEVDSNQRGALDDLYLAPCSADAKLRCALYCNGNVDVTQNDEVRLKFDDKPNEELVFKVTAVRNPMMRYKYLVVFCEEQY